MINISREEFYQIYKKAKKNRADKKKQEEQIIVAYKRDRFAKQSRGK